MTDTRRADTVEAAEVVKRYPAGETLFGLPVAAYMSESPIGATFASHWSTLPEHTNPERLFREKSVRSLVEGLKVERDAAWLAQNNLIARAEKAEASLASQAVPEGFVLPVRTALTAYEAQVLIGTSISGCAMSQDRVFDLKAAWTRLYGLGLIDRTDGIAIVTSAGEEVIRAMLAAIPAAPEVNK